MHALEREETAMIERSRLPCRGLMATAACIADAFMQIVRGWHVAGCAVLKISLGKQAMIEQRGPPIVGAVTLAAGQRGVGVYRRLGRLVACLALGPGGCVEQIVRERRLFNRVSKRGVLMFGRQASTLPVTILTGLIPVP